MSFKLISFGGIKVFLRRRKKRGSSAMQPPAHIPSMLTLEGAIDVVLKGTFPRARCGILVVGTDEVLLPPAYKGVYGRVCVKASPVHYNHSYRDQDRVHLRQHLDVFRRVRAHANQRGLTVKIVVHPAGWPDAAKVFGDLDSLRAWARTPEGASWCAGPGPDWFFAIR